MLNRWIQELNLAYMYIHAGGVFGLYDGTVDPLLKQLSSTNQVSIYSDNAA